MRLELLLASRFHCDASKRHQHPTEEGNIIFALCGVRAHVSADAVAEAE
jgi:hypothetical protein